MKRRSVFALLVCLAVAGGCASPAHYVEQKSDSGIVAIPDNSNTWPNYNMKAARALIEQHVGPNYEIIDQYKFKTGQSVRNDQQTNADQTQNRQTTTGLTTMQDITEWRIVYRRVSPPIANGPSTRGGTPGLTTMGGTGQMPGLAPGVVPVGGTVPVAGPPPGTVPSVVPTGGGAVRGWGANN